MNAPGQPWAGTASPRGRLLQAAIATVSTVGYDGTSVEMISQAAGLPEGEFERRFAGKDECCRAAFEDVCEHFDRSMLPIYARPVPPATKIAIALYTAADYCSEHEQRVRFGIQARSRYGAIPRAESSLRFHLGQMDSLRYDSPAAQRRIPEVAPELCVGFFLGLLVKLGSTGRLADLHREIPTLLRSIFTVYFGPNLADRFLRDHKIAEESGIGGDRPH